MELPKQVYMSIYGCIMITFLILRDRLWWVIVLYHPEKNFFPLLYITESGLFISGYFLQKLNKENPFFPKPEILSRLASFT